MAITNRKRLSTSLSYEHFEFLTEVCDKNKQKQSVIIEMGLEVKEIATVTVLALQTLRNYQVKYNGELQVV